jgi:cysteine-rich repeat protein
MTRLALLAIFIAACAQSTNNGGIPPNCGDGHVDSDEECDDGNRVGGDGCSAACQVESGNPRCGDGILETGEECDDGNTVGADGCTADCKIESTDIPCTPNTYRCGAGGDVEMCNNSGSAWLFVNSCTVGCLGGVCTDPTCSPGATRCHGSAVETCNATGDGWTATETCTTFCELGQCALAGLEINSNMNAEGQLVVAGDLVVTGQSTLTSATGDLTIIADNIRVDPGSAIAVSPSGVDARGGSCTLSYYPYSRVYANYGQTNGPNLVATFGGDFDAAVDGGGLGGWQGYYGCNAPAGLTMPPTHGGGKLHLIATHAITIDGQLLAAGENARSGDVSGGSGGGIQIAADTIAISGSISTAGGTYSAQTSGWGRVRLLYGNTLTLTGTIIGNVTQGRRPPLQMTSPTQPDRTLVYNDAFDTLSIAHERAFGNAQGYLHSIDQTEHAPPVPATGVFSGTETFDIPATKLAQGINYVHVAPIDANSALGSVESRFSVTINTYAPTLSSTSHTSPTTWYDNANPYFAWTLPQGLPDKHFSRVHYVFDHFGDTIPTKADTALATAQKQLLVSNVASGIWVLHVITEDTMGHLTKKAAHVVVRVGTDPGTGTVFGSVFDDQQHPVSGAVVRVNRGLFQATTNASGSYTINGVSAGSWEVSVQVADHVAPAQNLAVTSGGQASANFSVTHI